jgi:hypothetical protein
VTAVQGPFCLAMTAEEHAGGRSVRLRKGNLHGDYIFFWGEEAMEGYVWRGEGELAVAIEGWLARGG